MTADNALAVSLLLLGPRVNPGSQPRPQPAWVAADPESIDAALAHSQRRAGGGWYVVAPSRVLGNEPLRLVVAGRELVAYRVPGGTRVAPAACPHMGADLATGRVCDRALVCPWHGLPLGDRGYKGWKPLTTHDDGTLTWVQLGSEAPLEAPPSVVRPSKSVGAVYQMELRCDPQDVIANRLDPWHGAHLHPHSFADLCVLEEDHDRLDVLVRVKLFGSMQTESRVTFHCPGPRAIVMTIVEGVGAGSVLETHVTPIEPGRTLLTEATFAHSDRWLFRAFLAMPGARRLMRRLLNLRARKLWGEDAEYAERLYALRSGRDAQLRLPVASAG